jgi:hypothetical protein
MTPARPELGKQVRQTCLAARNHFYAATRWLEFLTSVPEFLAAFIRWTLTRERRHGKETEGALSGNDNRSLSAEPLDPRIRRIAEAIGRQLARAQDKLPAAANDNEPWRRWPHWKRLFQNWIGLM